MPRFICLLVLIVMVLQSCGSPTMDTTPESTVISAIQPSVVSTTTPPQRYPNLPSAPMRTPQSVVLTPTQAQSSEQAFPPECTYPLYTPAANVPVIKVVTHTYMIEEPHLKAIPPIGIQLAIEGWHSPSEVLVSSTDFYTASALYLYNMADDQWSHLITYTKEPYYPPLIDLDAGMVIEHGSQGFDKLYRIASLNDHTVARHEFDVGQTVLSRSNPDGQAAYVDLNHQLVVLDLSTSAQLPRKYSTIPVYLRTEQGVTFGSDNDWWREQYLVWSPDGQRLLAYSPFGLFLINPETADVCSISLTPADELNYFIWAINAEWRPDGRMLALHITGSQTMGDRPSRVILLDTQTGEIQPLTLNADFVQGVQWVGQTDDLLLTYRPGLRENLPPPQFIWFSSEDGSIQESMPPLHTSSGIYNHNTTGYRLTADGTQLAWICGAETGQALCFSSVSVEE